MNEQRIMEIVAEYFGIQPNDDGTYDIDDYDWQSGCMHGKAWLCPALIVKIIEDNFE